LSFGGHLVVVEQDFGDAVSFFSGHSVVVERGNGEKLGF
jgi:hypothetical protein